MKKALSVVLSCVLATAMVPTAACAAPAHKGKAAKSSKSSKSSKSKAKKMTVKATKSSIKVSMKGLSGKGKATVYRFKANQYPKADKMSGLVRSNAKGVKVGTYKLGSNKTLKLKRYVGGYDTLFDKYYVMRGSKIVKGPIYATGYSSQRKKSLTFKHVSKKGYAEEVSGTSTYNTAKKVKAKNAVITLDAAKLLRSGNGVGGKTISFKSNGKTYYFSKANVAQYDKLVKKFTKAKMNLTAAVWAYSSGYWSYPKQLTYTSNNSVTMAYNTKNATGRDSFIALMEFLGKRYSKSFQRVQTFIIGNEMDLAYDWARLNGSNKKVSVNKYMEEYARGLRLANLAVKKYSATTKVAMSTSNSWATNRYKGMGKGFYPKHTPVKNSYAPKQLIDWLCKYETARGNYDWALAPHAYDISTTKANYLRNDLKRVKGRTYKTVTASYKTSPWLTTSNTEILQQYLSKGSHKFKGKTRSVYLTESAISSVDNHKSLYLNRQAATTAQYYYRASCLPCVKQIAYYTYTTKDHKTYESTKLFGLYKSNGKKKPIFNLWKKIDTRSSFKTSKKYLKYLEYYNRKGRYCSVHNKRIKSYYDVMFADNPSYNYKSHWPFKKYVRAKRA